MSDARALLDSADTIDLLAALDAGTITSVQLLEAQLDRIDTFNPSVNAVVAFDIDNAMVAATEADQARSDGATLGPLHGLPITVKDVFETAGMVTTAGSPGLADHVPERDADVVEALRSAGAIIYGKTNVPLLAGDHQTYNDVYGVTRNPWDPDRTPGGSSGGSAAALACGFTTAEIGSDIGGSIRVPAHYTGVFGLKSSFGLLSQRGHIPGPPGSVGGADLAVMGPMGRSIRDLRLLLSVLLTVHPFDGVPGARLEPSPAPVQAAGLRVGLWSDDSVAPVASAVGETVTGVGAALAATGASVRHDVRPGIDSEVLHDLYLQLLLPGMAAGFPPKVYDAMVEAAEGEGPGATNARYSTMRHRDWLAANEARARAARAWDELFDEVDVMIAPVSQTVAIPHTTDRPYGQRQVDVDGVERRYDELLFWAGLATMPLLPSVVIPVTTIDGLPCGVQIIGRRWSDLQLLDRAEVIAEVAGRSFAPPPLITG